MEKVTFHAVAPGTFLAAHELVLEGSGEDKSLLVLSALGLCALAYRPLAEAFIKASSSLSSGLRESTFLDDDDDDDDGSASSSSKPAPPPRYRRVVFLDLRHHGESIATTEDEDDEKTPSSLSWSKDALWDTLAADLEAATKSLEFPSSSPPDLLAHSLGAGVAALACARADPGLFGSLFLFEPPFYPLVAAEEEKGGEGEKKRDLARDNASFAASAAAASSLSFESAEDAFSLLEVAPPFKWWHRSCRRAFVEHGLKKRRRRRRRGDDEGSAGEAEELVFRCGGRALAALASGLMTSSGGPSRETYRALGRRRDAGVVIVSYSAEPRSDVTAFLRAGALAAASEASAAASSPSSSSSVAVLPVRLPEEAKGARSGHYAPLVCPEELGRVAAAAMMTTTATKKKEERERSRF